MKKYLFFCCLIVRLSALEYIYTPSPVLFVGEIQGKQIMLSSDYIYALSGRYYQPVYKLPEKIKAAKYSENILLTDKYRIDFAQGIQLVEMENKNIPLKQLEPSFLAAEEITNIYVQEKLAGAQVLVFRHAGKYYLSLENTEQIKQVEPIALNFFIEAGVPHFSFNYKGQDFAYAKNGSRWNRAIAEQYFREDLEKLSAAELELLRALIEARKGRIFANKKIQNYLQKQKWYQPDLQYSSERLTRQELKNIELIYEIENAKIREGLYEQKAVFL